MPPRARARVVDVDVANDRVNASSTTSNAFVPPQEVFTSGADHRGATRTASHGKRKRDDDETEAMGDDDDEMDDDDERRAYKAPRPTYDVVRGAKSGRPWKLAAKRASALKRVPSAKTWDERMEEKAKMKSFANARKLAKAEYGAKLAAERERRAQKKAQKEDNRRRTGVGAPQALTNPKTIAKKSAKERAKLKALRML